MVTSHETTGNAVSTEISDTIVDSHARVAAVGQVLESTVLAPRERLCEAAKIFWTAIFYQRLWPALLREEASAIVVNLFARGPIANTIAEMDDTGIHNTLHRIEGFTRRYQHYHQTQIFTTGLEPVGTSGPENYDSSLT